MYSTFFEIGWSSSQSNKQRFKIQDPSTALVDHWEIRAFESRQARFVSCCFELCGKQIPGPPCSTLSSCEWEGLDYSLRISPVVGASRDHRWKAYGKLRTCSSRLAVGTLDRFANVIARNGGIIMYKQGSTHTCTY